LKTTTKSVTLVSTRMKGAGREEEEEEEKNKKRKGLGQVVTPLTGIRVIPQSNPGSRTGHHYGGLL
jgi:hypothetical protein